MEVDQLDDQIEHKNNIEYLKDNLSALINYLDLNEVNLIYENLVNFDLKSSNNQHSVASLSENLHKETWINFVSLNSVYLFQNEQIHWLGCSLYFAYEKLLYITRKKYIAEKRNQSTSIKKYSNTDKQQTNQHSNDAFLKLDKFPFFSILKLTKYLNLNLLKFLKMSKKMTEMLNVSNDLCVRLAKIESNYNVSSVLFNKYKTIFKNVFNCTHEKLFNFFQINKSDDRKYFKKQTPFEISDLFNFGWLIFINIRSKFPNISNDLVNSYHLLICCINFLYQNIDNLNQLYTENIRTGLNCSKPNWFFEFICTKYDGNIIEIKTINEYYFKSQLKYLIIDNNLTSLKSDSDLNFLKNNEIKRLKFINCKLSKIYDNFLLNQNQNVNDISLIESEILDLIHDIDERIFIDKIEDVFDEYEENETQVSDVEDEQIEIDNFKSDFKFDFVLPDCLKPILNHVKLTDDLETFQNIIDDVIKVKCIDLIQHSFKSQVLKNADEFNFINSGHLKYLLGDLIDKFFDLTHSFYLSSFEVILLNEKKRLGSENLTTYLNKLVQNETFQKSLYICCFEIMLNFTCILKTINLEQIDIESQNNSHNHVSNLENIRSLIELKSNEFEFPFSIKQIDLESFDFLRIIELFITNTSIVNQTHSSKNFYLNKQMIQHLNNIEEKILEHAAWQCESNLWTNIEKLKLLNPTQHNELTQLNYPFPLYDEVGLITNQQLGNSNTQSSILSTAVLTNCTNNESSPAKPTITRVVCSTNSSTTTTVSNDNMILTTKTVAANNSTKHIQVLTLTPTATKIPSLKQGRLINLTSYLSYFFRKFYNLANLRLRNLVDKLNIINFLNDCETGQSNQNQLLTPIASASTPILTPVTSANPNFKQIPQLNSEKYQILLKKIWNIFEYSLAQGVENDCSLIKNRHVDQLLLCAIYLTCKLNQIPISFTDILKCYKSQTKNSSIIYRSVLIDKDSYNDLIVFYNQVYVNRLKLFALQLNGKFNSQVINSDNNKVFITPVNNLLLMSPVPKPTAINLNMNIQFMSRKIAEDQSVFISPCKDRLSSSSVQFIQPNHNRNKLTYNVSDLNSNKVIDKMNEMIKKNEVKIKTSNKRLFSEISSHNAIPTNSSNSVITNVVSSKSYNGDDERDGRAKLTKINSFGNNYSRQLGSQSGSFVTNNSNFLSKIVSSKLGSTSNSNLVSMVVGPSTNQSQTLSSNLSLPIGSNFARRLQTIQTERTNVN